jgi:hypothetical protein
MRLILRAHYEQLTYGSRNGFHILKGPRVPKGVIFERCPWMRWMPYGMKPRGEMVSQGSRYQYDRYQPVCSKNYIGGSIRIAVLKVGKRFTQ